MSGYSAFDEGAVDLFAVAEKFNMKIWSVEKFLSVLTRCQPPIAGTKSQPLRTTNSVAGPSQRNLGQLLESERLNGTRQHLNYFSRNSFFVLVEDVNQELATIAAQEYEIPKGYAQNSAKIRVPWPVPYCHPHSRGPFVMFDEKEKRRWDRSQKEKEKGREDDERVQKERVNMMMRKAQTAPINDLRRTVSMTNLHRQADDLARDTLDQPESACASGFGASGYIAASGNSLAITSTTGTTSATGSANPYMVPPALRQRREVVTSRKAFTAGSKAQGNAVMGPPLSMPRRMLKKSKSTTTMRISKREETNKPGYCESCRTKFEDFRDVSTCLEAIYSAY
jgi:regulatory subunit for Cdc7p protein kinase